MIACMTAALLAIREPDAAICREITSRSDYKEYPLDQAEGAEMWRAVSTPSWESRNERRRHRAEAAALRGREI